MLPVAPSPCCGWWPPPALVPPRTCAIALLASLLLLHLGGGGPRPAHATQPTPHHHHSHFHPEPVAFEPPGGGFTPLNPDWAVRGAPCPYGELPGTWLPHVAPIIRSWDQPQEESTRPPRPPIPVTHGWDGRGWQVYDARCQLVDYLRRFITLEAMPAPEEEEDGTPVRLLFLGDRCGAVRCGPACMHALWGIDGMLHGSGTEQPPTGHHASRGTEEGGYGID